MSQEPVIALATGFGALNIVGQPAGVPRGYVDLRRAASKENLGHGLQPYVASAGDLAGMAAALNRDKDIARLPELRRIMELEVDRQQTCDDSCTGAAFLAAVESCSAGPRGPKAVLAPVDPEEI